MKSAQNTAQIKTNISPIRTPPFPSNNKKAIPITDKTTATQILKFTSFFLRIIQAKKGTMTVLNPVINPALPAEVVCNPIV